MPKPLNRYVIVKGWYRSAGHRYHWVPEFHIFGVGLALNLVMLPRKIIVNVEGEDYVVDTQDIAKFVRRYQSFDQKRTVTLGVFSKSIMTPLNPRSVSKAKQIEKQKVEILPSQLAMF